MSGLKMTKTPDIPQIDWTILIGLWSILTTIGGICIKIISSYHKAKKDDKELFIRSVVQATMQASLIEVNQKIDQLFDYRERDRESIDKKLDTILREARNKP